jgi:hypothetical protein
VDERPYSKHTAVLDLVSVKVVSEGSRLTFIFSTLKAVSFSGDLIVTIYNGSPLLHVEAAMATEDPRVAYIYDALLSGNFTIICFKNTDDQFVSITPSGELSAHKVRNRTIIAAFSSGSIAVFPPPMHMSSPATSATTRDLSSPEKVCPVQSKPIL